MSEQLSNPMELETISKLNKYKSSFNEEYLNDLIDFLISKKIIDEKVYFDNIYRHKKISLKLYEIFKIIESKGEHEEETVLKYLNDLFPNINKQIEEEQNFRISSVRGGFPKLPPNYISRNTLVEEVRSKLLELQWNQKLVVHGMVGYGKSCLVNEALNDISVRKHFDNYLFWINIGEHLSEENVFKPLRSLYLMASSIIEKNSMHCPEDVQTLKDLLIDLFLHPRLKNALIILDDACSYEVLEYFDIKCKTVITTQNKKILCNEDAIFVEVKTGFSRNESLGLFKKSLSTDHELPGLAEEIHFICKGHPMLIALIGSYLKDNAEDAKENTIIWEHIKIMFLRGGYNLNDYDDETEIFTEKIKKCIERLLAIKNRFNLTEFYHDLAIFPSDVNIPPEVLQIIWNKNVFEVRNIMNKFAEKSLVVPFYHKDLKTYIYGIHDIYLHYLKSDNENKLASLHKKLISGYDNITNGNYALLPNDNYTLQYIGYHLYHAREFHKFDIYFDFKFLEAKIRAVGTQDVLGDMQKYEIYITNGDNKLKEKLDQYKEFINRCGRYIYGHEKTDIIQFALAERKDSIVYKEALILAEKSNKLYLQLQKPVDEYDHLTINVEDDITSACFVESPHHILIGTASGNIKLFYEERVKAISVFVGHTKAVNKLILSSNKRHFLSVSEDGTVALWKFSADSARNSNEFSSLLPASPKIKQIGWQDLHTSDRGHEKPIRIFRLDNGDPLVSAAFCDQFPSVFEIVTGSEGGNVILWDAETGSQLYARGTRGYSAPSVIYFKSQGIVFACEDSIHFYNLGKELCTLYNEDSCVSLYPVSSVNTLISVNNKSIHLWKDLKRHPISKKADTEERYICATVTDDANYLVVSTNFRTVCVWHIEDKKVVKEFKSKGLVKSLDTLYDEDKLLHVLLIGSDQKTLQLCHILPDDKEQKIFNDFKFTPYWKKKHALIALVTNDNRIQVFNGSVQISETDVIESKVTCTCFTTCGQNVIYGLENGEVHCFNFRHKRSKCIESNEFNKQKSVMHLQCYNPNIDRSSISSTDSWDSGDFNLEFEGIIVSVFANDLVKVYHENNYLSKQINKPLIFLHLHNLILVDYKCHIFNWDLKTDTFHPLKNLNIPEQHIALLTASYCSEKNILGIAYEYYNKFSLNVSQVCHNKLVMTLETIVLDDRAVSSRFSCDGSLLAVGMISGDIMVWNLNQQFKTTKLSLHKYPVEDLIFSPTMEPVLVSLGEYVAWWNLKTFQKNPQSRGKPKSIDNLENIPVSTMDIQFWADRERIDKTDYLLSCTYLHGKARCLSASKDFQSFLTVDDKGKIYVMETVASNYD